MIGFGQCDRQQIVDDYNTIYLGSQVLPAQLGWTGDVSTCNPGTISALSLDNTLDRINYFRNLVGLPSNITFDSLLNQKCQEAALMMDANNSVNHNPPSTWLCYTTNGDDAAGSSNLASNSNSSSSITAYISDHGVNNAAVGHRRRILYTRANIFGTGSTYTKNALWVINNFITPAPVPFVAYPSPGFFPGPLVFGRWSFSIQNADFSLTTISMTNEQGINIPLTIEPITNGYGDNTIVWVPDPSCINNLFGSEDTKYTINILNVNNTVQQNYNYEENQYIKHDKSKSYHKMKCITGCALLFNMKSAMSLVSMRMPLAVLDSHYSFSTCPNSSSTGVERPKISTETRNRLFS